MVQRWRALAELTTADSWIVVVLVLALVEQWWALVTPTMADSSIAQVLALVEHKRDLVARTLVLVPYIHTNTGRNHTNMERTLDTRNTLDMGRTLDTRNTFDTGRSSTVTYCSTGRVGNSRKSDKPDQLPLQHELGLQCRLGLLPMPGPKTMTMRRWSALHRRSEQFLPS